MREEIDRDFKKRKWEREKEEEEEEGWEAEAEIEKMKRWRGMRWLVKVIGNEERHCGGRCKKKLQIKGAEEGSVESGKGGDGGK